MSASQPASGRPPSRRPRSTTLLAVLGFVVASMLVLVTGIPIELRLLLVGLAMLALVTVGRRASVPRGFEVDDDAVRQLRGGETVAQVAWTELIAVSIVTTAEGPWSPDFDWVLHGSDGQRVVVPLDQAAATSLLTRLGRLPGFDHAAVIEATSATENLERSCWTGAPGAAGPARGPL